MINAPGADTEPDVKSCRALRIPYALAESGARVRPENGKRGARDSCPECHERVVLRRGDIKVPHFAHYRAPESCRLTGEGWLHVAAKHAVFAAVMEGAEDGSSSVQLFRKCEICRSETWQSLPPCVRRAELEYRLPSGRVGDIALLDRRERVLAVVEIRHSHEVDSEKAEDLSDIPWIELSAMCALTSPERWRPLASAGLKPFHCRCLDATRLQVVQRGLALHVEGCPLPARVWRSKPYANVMHDCSQCDFLVGTIDVETATYGGPGIILCAGFGAREPIGTRQK
mgnify:CR=1 FL=1